jgi:hypothetical protein
VPNTRSAAKPGRGHKYGGALGGVPGAGVSYGGVDAATLHDAITTVVDNGDAITFGRTSEGGAYYVGILCEGTLEKFYLDSGQDLESTLVAIAGQRDA